MSIKERLYHYGRDAGGQSVLVLAALMNAKIGSDDMEMIRDWPIPIFPLTGADLKTLGIGEGPHMGQILKAVEEWWIEWDFQQDRAQCLDRAREIFKN